MTIDQRNENEFEEVKMFLDCLSQDKNFSTETWINETIKYNNSNSINSSSSMTNEEIYSNNATINNNLENIKLFCSTPIAETKNIVYRFQVYIKNFK